MVRLAPMKRESSKVEMPARRAKVAKVPEIVDAPEGLDSCCELGGLPVAVAEVVQVEVAAIDRRVENVGRAAGRQLVEGG